VDVVAGQVEKAALGVAPVPEPGLAEMYRRHRERIAATGDAREAVLETDASFIIVPTLSKPDGEFDTVRVRTVAESIGNALREKQGYHLVVVTSTVLPGATERDIKPALERTSAKVCGEDFGLCYSPEFIAIGDVINGLLHPDFFLIGEFDRRSGDILEAVYRQEGGDGARMARMNIPNAELTKISVNAFVTMKISFANTLGRICRRMAGGDAEAVTQAVGMDLRIGAKYLKPGAAFGGPCFPRDNRAFAWFGGTVGEPCDLARATDSVNRQQLGYLRQLVREVTPSAGKVAVLGLAYKPRTGVMEESQGVAIAGGLRETGHEVVVHEPLGERDEIAAALPGVTVAGTVAECVAGVQTIVVATAHEGFGDVDIAGMIDDSTKAVVDIWGVWRDVAWPSGVRYVTPWTAG